MIRVVKGSATEREVAAIEQALRERQSDRNQSKEFGKPILRAPFEINEKPNLCE